MSSSRDSASCHRLENANNVGRRLLTELASFGRLGLKWTGAGYKWTEEAANGWNRLEMDIAGWKSTEEAANGRGRLQMDGEGWQFADPTVLQTPLLADSRRRTMAQMDGVSCKWTEEAANG